MAQALRPSNEIKNKQNVIPSINRINEATAEDFKEIADILIDHAVHIDEISRAAEGSKFYGFFTSLALLEAQFPDAEVDGFAVIDPGTGDPQSIAKFNNAAWTVTVNTAPIQLYTTKTARPAEGQSGIWYIVLDEKIAYLWHNGGYIGFGKDGNNGLSAYEVAVAFGFQGTEAEWLESIKGASAYEVAVDNGFQGTEAEWVASIEGVEGKSAYEVAVANGFQGTEAEWLTSLEGEPGDEGASAYEVAVANGFVGTEAEWVASLKGEKGDAGAGFENIPATAGKVGVTDGNGGIIWEDKASGGTAPVSYLTMAALYAGQAQQVVNGSYRVDDASAHPDVQAGRAWFDYLGTTNGDATDYILRSEEESMNLDAQLTAIENRLTALESKPPVPVSTSRLLTLADKGRKLYVTANITLTYPTGGLGTDFEFNVATSAAGITNFADQNAGADLDSPDGLILTERKMCHAFVVNGKLNLYGDLTA